MVNNLEVIKQHLIFPNERSFYFIQIIKRKKENPEMTGYSLPVESYYIFSAEQLDRVMPHIIEKCEQNRARAYIKMNTLDMQSVALETISVLTQEIRKENWKHISKALNSACGICGKQNGTEKLYLVDIDSKDMDYIEENRVMMTFEMPLNEVIYDFFDSLKSRSKGYASFDYEIKGYEQSELVKLDILVNKEEVDALSFIVHAQSAYERGRKMCEKLKDEIPRHLFEIPIQAAVGGKVIARETVKAMRKDVLAKCYGGDISRKRKLLEKQKEGKKRMRQVGNVEIPQEAFMSVLKLDED